MSKDNIINNIHIRVKNIIENTYLNNNINPDEVRNFLKNKKNFKNFLKKFKDLELIYDQTKFYKTFDEQVRSILDRFIKDKKYFYLDQNNENLITKYNIFLKEKFNIKKTSD